MAHWPLSLFNECRRADRPARRLGQLPLPLAMLDADRPAEPAAREEPLRHRPRAARPARRRRAPALPDRAHARRDVQRPRRPADGQPRQPLRAQRPARVHGPRAGGQAARAESAARQPRAPDAGRVHAGDDAQPARRRVDPVRGARLVQPRQERGREPVASSRSPTTTRGRSTRCRSSGRGRDPSADPTGPPTFVTDDTHWWDGSQIYGRDPAFAERAALGRARQAADRRARPAAEGPRGARRPHRRRGQLLGRARAPALALHARAQRDLRPPARDASRAVRRRALRQGAPRRRGADGEDPHDRLDAGDHRPPDDGDRAAHELVGARGRAARQAHRPAHVERGDPRHPRLADEPPRRPVLADRGVRRASTACTR